MYSNCHRQFFIVSYFNIIMEDLNAEWEPWSVWSATCEGGTQMRSRTVAQSATNGGKNCEGKELKAQRKARAEVEGRQARRVRSGLSPERAAGMAAAEMGGGGP